MNRADALEIHVAYEHCRRLTRRAAKNFYFAFVTLPPDQRRAIYAAYAFARLCDDASDEEIDVEQKLRLLRELRERLALAYEGHPRGPVFTALADAAKRFNIPREHFEELTRGVEMDLTVTRYATFDDLRLYCYRVASVVGLICLPIFGCRDPRAKDAAIDLGLAMQITNILRDVKEDLGRGRIYLPQDEITRFGYSEAELLAGVANDKFLALMRFQAERARGYYESAAKGLPLLSARSRACPSVLGGLYRRILDRLEARDFNVFEGRVSLSGREKVLLTARLWISSLLPASAPR